jgi:hypothetical protein
LVKAQDDVDIRLCPKRVLVNVRAKCCCKVVVWIVGQLWLREKGLQAVSYSVCLQ